MKTKHFLLLTALLGVVLTPLGAKKAVDEFARFKKKLTSHQQVEQALNRLTFGPRPGDIEAVQKRGLKKWIEAQLNPASVPENPQLLAKLDHLASLKMSTTELVQHYPTPQVLTAIALGRQKMPEDPELRPVYERMLERYKVRIDAKKNKKGNENEEEEVQAAAKQVEDRMLRRVGQLSTEERSELLRNYAPRQAIVNDLTEAKVLRAVMSEHQLEEVLVDFWFNHFNIYLDKGADRVLTTAYERDAIRPYVFGNFKDMLKATAQHPAMLFYLDNWQSVGEEAGEKLRRAQKAKGRTRGLNENYGREILELHTLGVDGGYTQKDVTEVARCFTGWTIDDPNRGGKFRFNERAHDRGEKIVLGQTIPAGGGIEDGYKVIDILVAHPSTARFLSRKLAQRFVADNPPPALIDRMAATFQKSHGDLKAVLRTMLQSPEFFSAGAYKAKIKSPLEMVAGAIRATGAEVTSALQLTQAIANMGQPLYRKVEPTGYSNNGEDWLNSAGLLARINFALALSDNKILGVKLDRDKYATVAKNMGAPEWQRR